MPILKDVAFAEIARVRSGRALLRLLELRQHHQPEVRLPLEAVQRPAGPRQLSPTASARRRSAELFTGQSDSFPNSWPTRARRRTSARQQPADPGQPAATAWAVMAGRAGRLQPGQQRRSASRPAATRTCCRKRPPPRRWAWSTARVRRRPGPVPRLVQHRDHQRDRRRGPQFILNYLLHGSAVANCALITPRSPRRRHRRPVRRPRPTTCRWHRDRRLRLHRRVPLRHRLRQVPHQLGHRPTSAYYGEIGQPEAGDILADGSDRRSATWPACTSTALNWRTAKPTSRPTGSSATGARP